MFSANVMASESLSNSGAQSFTSMTESRSMAREVSGGLPQSVANRLTL